MSRAVLAALVAAYGCGGSTSATIDASPGGADAAGSDAAGGSGSGSGIDAATGPSGVDCFSDRTLTGCSAPVIEAAYLGNDCDATTGIFVVGHGFESANLFEVNNGWLAHGPNMMSPPHTGDFWNVLTPTFMCLTTSSDPGTWANFDMTVTNPDGQQSNAFHVTNELGQHPPLPSTGSSNPFDPDACLDAGMTHAEATATFAVGASTSTLGSVDVHEHTRQCNTATGCLPWAAATTRTTVAAGLAIAGGGSTIDFTLGGTDCGALGASDYTLTYNDCSLPSGEYTAHVAGHCLAISQTKRSTIAGDGSYTQTDADGLIRF